MIVAGPEGFIKNQYRKFNMKTEEFQGDDFAMMKAMIRRRFARMLQEREEDARDGRSSHRTGSAPMRKRARVADGGVDFSKERDNERRKRKFGAWPDLVLIDGGDGQLNAALEALDELGLKNRIAIAGIAKGVDRDAGRERFFMPGKRAVPARREKPGPLLPAALARRSAPLRHRRTSRQAQSRASPKIRSTKSAASARRASALCSIASARRAAFRAPALAELELRRRRQQRTGEAHL